MNTTDSDRDPVDVVADEFAGRLRNGEYPSVTEYVRRYPEHADALSEVLPAVALIEQLKVKDDSHVLSLEKQGAMSGLKRLGDFRILREIGHGGMGVVYEAVQESLGRHVALKVLSPTALSSANAVNRFRREAETAARLHHTNIVPVFGVGEEAGLNYYVMQFIDGEALSEIIQGLRDASGVKAATTKPQNTDLDQTKSFVPKGRPSEIDSNSLLEESFFRAAIKDSNNEPDETGPTDQAARTGGMRRNLGLLSSDNLGERAAHTMADGRLFPASVPTAPAKTRRETTQRLVADFGAKNYWHAVASMGTQVGEALQYAHSLGVLHRDVKPANLLLADGVVWLVDFGLAKLSEENDLTQTGDLMGTLRYMAPEQLSGKCDARSEVYSLGLTLYELATFQYARGGSIKSQIIQQITDESPPRPRSVNKEIPSDLETIILKAMAIDPKHRYQTAGELATDLERFVNGFPIAARRVGRFEHLLRWTRRNPALATTTFASFVLLITVACLSTSGMLLAQQANFDLEKERNKVQAEHRRAEDNVSMAMVAFESLVDDVASRGVPQSLLFEEDEDAGEVPIPSRAITQGDRELLGQLLKFYREFAAKNQTSPQVAESTARAYRRVGDIHRWLGEHDKAIAAYDDAAKKYAEIVEPTDKLQHALNRASLYNSIGIVETKRRNYRQASEAYVSVIRYLERQPDIIRNDNATSFLLASTYNLIASNNSGDFGNSSRNGPPPPGRPGNGSSGQGGGNGGSGNSNGGNGGSPDRRSGRNDGGGGQGGQGGQGGERENGRPDQRGGFVGAPTTGGFGDPRFTAPGGGPVGGGMPFAPSNTISRETARRNAFDLLGELVKSDSANPEYRLELAKYYRNGVFASSYSSHQDALQDLNQAVLILDALVREFPDQAQYRFELADTLAITCPSLDRAEDLVDRSARYNRSVTIASDLHTGFPDVLDYTVLLANSTYRLSQTFEYLKDYDNAKKSLDQAIVLQRELAVQHAMSSFSRAAFGRMLVTSAKLDRRDNEFEQALKKLLEARDVLTVKPESGPPGPPSPPGPPGPPGSSSMQSRFLQWQLSEVMMSEVDIFERMGRDEDAKKVKDELRRFGRMYGSSRTEPSRGGYNGPPRKEGPPKPNSPQTPAKTTQSTSTPPATGSTPEPARDATKPMPTDESVRPDESPDDRNSTRERLSS